MSPPAHPQPPAHGSFLPIPRSRAPAAGSALETRGGEPPSYHPCQRHLCHTPPMSQQPHEPDQEPTGAAQWQCQCPLYSLCKSPFQVLRKEGGRGEGGCTDLGCWGWSGKRAFGAGRREWGRRLVQPHPDSHSFRALHPTPSPGAETGNHFPEVPCSFWAELGGEGRGRALLV